MKKKRSKKRTPRIIQVNETIRLRKPNPTMQMGTAIEWLTEISNSPEGSLQYVLPDGTIPDPKMTWKEFIKKYEGK